MIMIPELGIFSLIIAFVLAGILATSQWVAFKGNTLTLLWGKIGFIILGFATLVLCFIQNNFSVSYVALNSNTALPFIYKICAVWGAHEGSLLLWILILALWTIAVIPLKQQRIVAVLSMISAGLLFILLHTSNPFLRLLPDYPPQGIDLNPLLQDPGFVLHPPILYLGYVGFVIPFAFSISALLEKDQAGAWVQMARPFALMAWGFLTIGIALGSWWAYYELGWGGWWFWDPVENASLMPWLMGGALCHALMLSSKRKQYLGWCHLLAMGTFILSLMGTFLVRSGMISSVHAFASDPKRGLYILLFLFSVFMASFVLFLWRWRPTKSGVENEILTKDAGILLGNVLLVVMTLTVLLGTLYPLAMEIFLEKRMSVGAPYFKTMFTPFVAILLLLMSLVPYIPWESGSFSKLLAIMIRRIRIPLIAFLGSALVLALVGLRDFFAYGGVLLATWLIISILYRCVQKGRWGMGLAHIGLGISIIGMILVNHLETEVQTQLAVGQSKTLGDTTVRFQSLEVKNGPNFEGRQGHFTIERAGKSIAELYPEKRYFPARETVMTEVAIRPGFLGDYFIALGEKLDDDRWSVRIHIKPFVRWIWFGAVLIAVGAFYSGSCQLRKNNGGKKQLDL